MSFDVNQIPPPPLPMMNHPDENNKPKKDKLIKGIMIFLLVILVLGCCIVATISGGFIYTHNNFDKVEEYLTEKTGEINELRKLEADTEEYKEISVFIKEEIEGYHFKEAYKSGLEMPFIGEMFSLYAPVLVNEENENIVIQPFIMAASGKTETEDSYKNRTLVREGMTWYYSEFWKDNQDILEEFYKTHPGVIVFALDEEIFTGYSVRTDIKEGDYPIRIAYGKVPISGRYFGTSMEENKKIIASIKEEITPSAALYVGNDIDGNFLFIRDEEIDTKSDVYDLFPINIGAFDTSSTPVPQDF